MVIYVERKISTKNSHPGSGEASQKQNNYTSRGFNSTMGALMEFVRDGGFLKDSGLEKEAERELVLDAVFFLYRGLYEYHRFTATVKTI